MITSRMCLLISKAGTLSRRVFMVKAEIGNMDNDRIVDASKLEQMQIEVNTFSVRAWRSNT